MIDGEKKTRHMSQDISNNAVGSSVPRTVAWQHGKLQLQSMCTLQRSIDRCHFKPCVFELVVDIIFVAVPRRVAVCLNQRGRFPARNEVVKLFANIRRSRSRTSRVGVYQICKAPFQVQHQSTTQQTSCCEHSRKLRTYQIGLECKDRIYIYINIKTVLTLYEVGNQKASKSMKHRQLLNVNVN